MGRQTGCWSEASNDAACDQIMALVAQHKHVPLEMLRRNSRCRTPAARARQLAMYLSHVALGGSLTRVGQAFGRDRTTVSYACALIEDMRDDPRFDDEVCELEGRIEALIGPAGVPSHGH